MSSLGVWGIFGLVLFLIGVLIFRDRYRRYRLIKAQQLMAQHHRHCVQSFPNPSAPAAPDGSPVDEITGAEGTPADPSGDATHLLGHQRRLLKERLGDDSRSDTSSTHQIH